MGGPLLLILFYPTGWVLMYSFLWISDWMVGATSNSKELRRIANGWPLWAFMMLTSIANKDLFMREE